MPTSVSKLDSVIAALEGSIMHAPDSEYVGERMTSEAAEVRQVIRQELDDHPELLKHRSLTERPTTNARELQEKIRVLRRLAARRPELGTRLELAFGSNKVPSEDRINELIDEFTRAGFLSKRKN